MFTRCFYSARQYYTDVYIPIPTFLSPINLTDYQVLVKSLSTYVDIAYKALFRGGENDCAAFKSLPFKVALRGQNNSQMTETKAWRQWELRLRDPGFPSPAER